MTDMTKTRAPAEKAAKKAANLTQPYIDKLRPKAIPYRVWDTSVPQLHIRIQPSGIKSWNVQWSRGATKSLGKWPGVTVEAAREQARKLLIETHKHGAPLAVVEANRPDHERPRTWQQFIDDDYGPWVLTHTKAGAATLAAIRSVFGSLDSKLLTEIVELDIERIKSKRLKAGIKPATANRDLDRIRAALAKAVAWKFLSEHPLKDLGRIKVDNKRKRYLSADEEKRLYAAIDKREATRREQRASANAWRRARGIEPLPEYGSYTDHLPVLVALALHTGCRRGELLSLAWESIDRVDRTLTVEAANAKSGVSRHIPLNTEAFDALARWRKQHGNPDRGLVFPGRDAANMTHFNSAWRAVVESAKLRDLHFHDLRHTFASRLVKRGASLAVVQELLGHADIATTMRYSHVDDEMRAAAVASLAAKEPVQKQESA